MNTTSSVSKVEQSSESIAPLTLLGLVWFFWRRKLILFFCALIGAVSALVLDLYKPDTYKSTALLAPVSIGGKSGISSLVGDLGGLASMAGVDLSGGDSSKVSVALQILRSRSFLASFIRKHNIEVEVFAAEGWSPSDNSLRIDKSIYSLDKKEWMRDPKLLKPSSPTDNELYKSLDSRIRVNEDKVSGMITLELEYYSPYLAAEWLNMIVRELDETMRERDISNSERKIEYLSNTMETIANSDIRTVFYQLIEQETRSMMLAKANAEYVFHILDDAYVAEEPAGPGKIIVVVIGLMVGVFLAVIILLVFLFSDQLKHTRKSYD